VLEPVGIESGSIRVGFHVASWSGLSLLSRDGRGAARSLSWQIVDLNEALRSTGAAREFRPEPVADDVIERILDTARFAPSGGNRQGWRVIVVDDPTLRSRLRDFYVEHWYAYLAQRAAGLTPWAPVTDRDAEAAAIQRAGEVRAEAEAGPGGFAEHFDEVPVLLVVLADQRNLAAVDRDLDRYTMVGGASIYPFVWSILLAARDEGLGGVMTTMVIRSEPEVKELLDVPDELAIAAVVALGHPVVQPRRLRRSAVPTFTSVDRYGGAPFGSAGAAGGGAA
jgi:nitroreductase